MGFLEPILRVAPDKLMVEHVQSLIDNRVEENLNLDYKSIKSFENPKDLCKHVSSFANAAGGIIILGVEEEKEESSKGQGPNQELQFRLTLGMK